MHLSQFVGATRYMTVDTILLAWQEDRKTYGVVLLQLFCIVLFLGRLTMTNI